MKLLKYLIFLPFMFMPFDIFAISCGTGGNILYEGNTFSSAKEKCGEPTSILTSSTSIFLSEQWQYFISLNNGNTGTTKITFLFNNNKLVNISANGNMPCSIPSSPFANTDASVKTSPVRMCQGEYSVNSIPMCGTIVQLGTTADFIQRACGQPSIKNILQNEVEVTIEATFPGDSTIFVFKNDKFTSWHR